jgi:hypothetical protein
MTEEEINLKEHINSGTSKTKNKTFDKNGYLLVKDLIDPQELVCGTPEVPELREESQFYRYSDKFAHIKIEPQVNGSLSRSDYPPYKEVHYKLKKRVESIIGEDLYPTHYFDRFYFPGQELPKHTDKDSCEISVSVHLRTNLKDPWSFWIKGCDTYNDDKSEVIEEGKVVSGNLNPGDGIIYKGCERPHWRESMPGVRRNKIRKLFGKEEFFYHQIFFHYVLANGNRVHHAWDMQNSNRQ